jgi:AcrR family transcriptional regulator
MARRASSDKKIGLLRAAEACFIEHGLERTKVEDITARAGIAKGAFYTYFESKEECWRQIVDAFLVRLSEACEEPEALRDRQRPFAERHRMSLEFDISVLNFCWENRAMLGVLLNGAGGAAYAHLLDEFAARSAKNSEQRMRELCAEGVFEAELDPKLVAALVAGAYERLVRQLIKEHKRPAIERLARQTKQVFERGLLSPETRALLDRPVTKGERRGRNGTRIAAPRRRSAAALADSARRSR